MQKLKWKVENENTDHHKTKNIHTKAVRDTLLFAYFVWMFDCSFLFDCHPRLPPSQLYIVFTQVLPIIFVLYLDSYCINIVFALYLFLGSKLSTARYLNFNLSQRRNGIQLHSQVLHSTTITARMHVNCQRRNYGTVDASGKRWTRQTQWSGRQILDRCIK